MVSRQGESLHPTQRPAQVAEGASIAERRKLTFLLFSSAQACAVAGVGFYTDAYDIFAINLAAVMIGYTYRPMPASGLPALTPNQVCATFLACKL